MTTQQAQEVISVELFTRMIDNLEARIKSQSFKNEVKYHSEAINKAMFQDFKSIVNVLQAIVNKFYLDKYEISGFQAFSVQDFDFCVSHNLSLINNCKKLIRFAK